MDNLLSVRKQAVGRTHSLPNDSYMFFPLKPFCTWSSPQAKSFAFSQGPLNPLSIHRALSGNVRMSLIIHKPVIFKVSSSFPQTAVCVQAQSALRNPLMKTSQSSKTFPRASSDLSLPKVTPLLKVYCDCSLPDV